MSSKYNPVKSVPKLKHFFSKETFKRSNCLLTINIGREFHGSENFATIIDLVNNNFASCVILINDALQRHTMALQGEQGSDFFYEASLKKGDLWLASNEKYFSQLKIPNKIIRWDLWLQHPRYAEQKQRINALIKTDPLYEQTFKDSIDQFLRRHYKRFPFQDKLAHSEKDFLLCLDYLLEECTALCLWPELGCHFVYPNKRNLAMEATYRRFVLPESPDLLHELSIKFKKKQLKAQNLEYRKKWLGKALPLE